MLAQLRSSLTYANVMATVAVFITLGGTSYAVATASIDSREIKNNTVRSKDLRNNDVRGKDIRRGTVGRGDLAAGAVDGSKVADGSLTGADVNERLLDLTTLQARLRDSCPSGQAIRAVGGGGELTCQPVGVSGSFWRTTGNAGTSGADFLGTTDNQPLNLRVNDARGLRLEPASDGTNQSPNVIGGSADNAVTAGVHAATIGGGGRLDPANAATANRVTDNFGTVAGGRGNQAGNAGGTPADRALVTVGGGEGNTASGSHATVGGGGTNLASGSRATVGGGEVNTATGLLATVGGGGDNHATANDATVSGGLLNTAGGFAATVPGGYTNTAGADYTLAAGRRAKANHQGAFVWADSQDEDMASSLANQFIVRAQGGFYLQNDASLDQQPNSFLNTSTTAFLSAGGTWVDASDENLKEGFEAVEPTEVLAKVAALPVRSWAYEAEPGVRHLGPTGQDFHAAFGLGSDDRHIAALDGNGVALAAIKGLDERLRALHGRVGGSAGETDGSSPWAGFAALVALGAFALGLGLGFGLRLPRHPRARPSSAPLTRGLR